MIYWYIYIESDSMYVYDGVCVCSVSNYRPTPSEFNSTTSTLT